MDLTTLAVVGIIALAALFDFTNGFHDSANSIATVVATHVLKPKVAVVWAAGWNFLAFFVIGTAVADTVGETVKSQYYSCLLYTSPSPRDRQKSRMPSSA